MDSAALAAESVVEANHWWFVGRRFLLSRIIAGFNLSRDATVLDIGTGTGTNLRMLRDLGFADVTGLDQSEDAIRFCAEKGLGHVQLGDVCELPFPDGAFDLVLATDILEHVAADRVAVGEIRRVLKPDGHLLLTAPTFQILWGTQDDVSHHQRRYRMPDLLEKLRAGGLSPQEHFYFNYLLFIPILVARRLIRLLGVRLASENQLNPRWLNTIFTPLFLFDIKTASWLNPPVGVSALVVAAHSRDE